MSDWFSTLAAGSELPMDAASELQERGFVVLPGPVPPDRVEQLANAYTAAMASASRRRHQDRQHLDSGERFRESWRRVR